MRALMLFLIAIVLMVGFTSIEERFDRLIATCAGTK
jgi:hypothetical protein